MYPETSLANQATHDGVSTSKCRVQGGDMSINYKGVGKALPRHAVYQWSFGFAKEWPSPHKKSITDDQRQHWESLKKLSSPLYFSM